MNDMPQSEPAGQEQVASVQQARRLGPLPCPHTATCQARPYRVLIGGGDRATARCLLTSQPHACPRQLVAGEELGADSIKDDARIAPAQATPQPLVHRQHQG